MKQIKVGVGFGLFRLGLPSPETIVEVAEQAEGWGLDSFWLSDHLLAPSAELDVVATLALLASRTSRIKLGPSVFLLNLRHPLVAAIAERKDAARDLSLLLLEQAQILDGELPEDPAAFASRLNGLVLRGLAKENG